VGGESIFDRISTSIERAVGGEENRKIWPMSIEESITFHLVKRRLKVIRMEEMGENLI
jgi:hypothetical protein